MSLPGFTAKDSIYRGSGHYRSAAARAQNPTLIHPARLNQARRPKRIGCIAGTYCVTDPRDPSCKTCTYIDENCEEGLSYHSCEPNLLQCTPQTLFCNPLDQFCDICTDIDARCQLSERQVCHGVKVPGRVEIPDPVRGRSLIGR